MRFSILHLSDLHRDLRDEVANGPLLDSLVRDRDQYERQNPPILAPSICVVSGDLVYGVKPGSAASAELDRQYSQAEEFLAGIADTFFAGNRERVVVLPGNHDVSYPAMLESAQRIDIPAGASERKLLTDELFAPRTRLRWSWPEMCFYRICDEEQYERRLEGFARIYERFYSGTRAFSLSPEKQFDLFDYPDLGFSIVALNSCFQNDPLRRAGGFNPTAFSAACRELKDPKRVGWLLAATWHHNIAGGPVQDDYLDVDFLQLLIDAGVSLGFHGHQHVHDCIDERYRLGPGQRKMTTISASTLCAEPRNLKPGVPRGYNVVELDTDKWVGRVHSRHMVNSMFNLPVWGPGHFIASGTAYFDFEICQPTASRPPTLDFKLALERADRLLEARKWNDALEVLLTVKLAPLARPMIVKALNELGDAQRMLEVLWPPETNGEAVAVGGAILELNREAEAKAFINLGFVVDNKDASVNDICRRLRVRWPQ
jgi:3',5'-cyclic AMP phosphodiesterase CpdA